MNRYPKRDGTGDLARGAADGEESAGGLFVSDPMRVEAGWVDYNGHLNMAYYVVMLDRAIDALFARVGLGPDYAASRNASFFTAEMHVRYLRELTLDDHVRVTARLLATDRKRVHAYFELRHDEDGWIAAAFEVLFLHVDLSLRRAADWPEDIARALRACCEAHAALPAPERIGRGIAMPTRRA